MNPQMQSQNVNSQIQQDPTQKANQARASMGFATNLMTQMLQHQNPQQEPQSEPQPEEKVEEKPNEVQTNLKDMESKFMEELSSIKDMIEKNKPKEQNKELEDLKKQITDVLNENDNETTEA